MSLHHFSSAVLEPLQLDRVIVKDDAHKVSLWNVCVITIFFPLLSHLQFGCNRFGSEMTKITVTFMKEISQISSQLFKNY